MNYYKLIFDYWNKEEKHWVKAIAQKEMEGFNKYDLNKGIEMTQWNENFTFSYNPREGLVVQYIHMQSMERWQNVAKGAAASGGTIVIGQSMGRVITKAQSIGAEVYNGLKYYSTLKSMFGEKVANFI